MADPPPPDAGCRPIRLIVADHHDRFRDGLVALFADHGDFDVLAEATSVAETLDLARRLRPDVVVVDIDLPAPDGLAATRRLAEEAPGVGVVVMTLLPDDDRAIAALSAGARRCVSKDLDPAQLVAAVREAAPSAAPGPTPDVADTTPGRDHGFAPAQPVAFDPALVRLSLLIDQGEAAAAGRWQVQEQRFTDLGELLAAAQQSAIVLLGPPGSGKSMLLRQLAADMATGTPSRLTCFAALNRFGPIRGAGRWPEPAEWLAAIWSEQHPGGPDLAARLAEGRVLLLLDGLNEMPVATEADRRRAVAAWRRWLQALAAAQPGNRVVFSCRSLDYSQPLSTTELPVPQARIEALTDDDVRGYLERELPDQAESLWASLAGSPAMEVLRTPYYLARAVEQVAAGRPLPAGRAALSTLALRASLRRELARGNPLLVTGRLLAPGDRRRLTLGDWRHDFDLPEEGLLVPKLAALAFDMQDRATTGEARQLRLGLAEALDLLGDRDGEAVLQAAGAVDVLSWEPGTGEVLFAHQLLQEYFAARRLAERPEPERVHLAWRANEQLPGLRELLATLPLAEPLPPLPTTGWEETGRLAAAMAPDVNGFVGGVMDTNLALAGAYAAAPDVRSRLAPELLDTLRSALLARSRDPDADLRDRIAAGLALGNLGDPRLERRTGPYGDYLLPPMVEIPGGVYPIGDDEPVLYSGQEYRSHVPRHSVAVEAFAIGQYPVTNAEYACFMADGGYAEERWWDTPDGRAWRSGEGTASGPSGNVWFWWRRFGEHPEQLDAMYQDGALGQELYERWQWRLTMDEAELAAHLRAIYPDGRRAEPSEWHNPRFNNPAQPVVGVSWYEARAYCAWLAAATSMPFRLPAEVEWEAAARGLAGRRYPHGESVDALPGNTSETRLMRTAPVGVFVDGATPEGVQDLMGNVMEWTSSLFGPQDDEALFGYPYKASDGREDTLAGIDMRRVARGGDWFDNRLRAVCSSRGSCTPNRRNAVGGFRVARASAGTS